MYCLIKEWPSKKETLMTEDGVVLWTFNDVEEAHKVWQDWCSMQDARIENKITYLSKFESYK